MALDAAALETQLLASPRWTATSLRWAHALWLRCSSSMATKRSLSFWRRICSNLSLPEGAAAFNQSKIDPTPVLLLLPLLLQSPLLLDSAIFFTIRARGGKVIMRLRNFLTPCPYFSSIVLLARASLFFPNFCRQIGRRPNQ